MKRNIYFLILSLFIFSNVFSQIHFADTKGELTVNGMGAANYKVPIALPPGIKDVAPQIALTYSSSGNNGIAGYGWNIVGISSITRTSTRIDIDGYVDGVDFDANDQFALDGQRLVKDGRSAPNGDVYYTENYSNLKIRSTGTATYPGASGSGPEKFTITFPDGTQAFYGSTTNSRGVSEWLIDKWIDPQGNTIEYEYVNNSNVTYIRFIRWSKNANIGTNGYENLMEFVYKNRARPEKAYLHGIAMTNNWLLDRVEVKTGGNLFRKYQLTHVNNDLSYQNLSQIQEFNGNNEPANPLIFNYNSTNQNVVITSRTYSENITEANINPQQLGDFDGDGLLDAVINGKLYRNIFNPIGGQTIVSDYNLRLHDIRKSPMTIIDTDGKLIQAQTVLIDTHNGGYGSDPSVEQNHELYLTANKFNVNSNLFEPVFTRTVHYPWTNRWVTVLGTTCANADNNGITYLGSPGKKYIEGDFDGDGISDLLILGKMSYNQIIAPEDDGFPPHMQFCETETTFSYVPAYFVSMNSNIPDHEASFVLSSDLYYEQTIHVIDFDGDGKQEIMRIGNLGHYRIYKVDIGNKALNEILSGQIPEYKEDNVAALFFGDYNGDSKIDILTPKGKNNSSWSIYFSTGKSFVKQDVNIREYIENFSGDAHRGQYVYKVLDLNKDGKSDFVSIKLEQHNAGGGGQASYYEIDAYSNLTNSTGNVQFNHFYYKKTGSARPFPGLPITGEFKSPSANFELMILKDDYQARTVIDAFNFQKDQSTDMRLKSISEVNGNILSELTYNSLEPNSANGGLGDINGNYFSSNQELYPYVEIKRLPHVNVVSKLKVSAMGKSKEREFKYFGLTSHSHGLGILGFKIMAQSSWVTSGIETKIWQVNHTSPTLRGAPIGNWSFSGNNLSLITNPVDNQLLSKNTLWYTVQNLPHNRYVQLPYQQVENDFLTGVTTTTNSEFDTYWNLKKSTVQKGGTYVTEYTYANNAAGTGTNYYIGRLTKKATTSYAYGDTRTSEEKYTYTGNLLTKTETKGHNTDYITETIQYDGLGNVTQKTTSAPGVSSRTIKNEYEATGRFVKKKTDVDGLITNLTYNNSGQVLTLIDPFNVTTTSTYDHWGKLTNVTVSGGSEVPLITNYNYSRNPDGSWNVTSDCFETKAYSKTYYDVLGRNIKNRTKGFGSDTYIAKKTEYDFLGRITQESEPYFDNSESGSPSQWNTIEYDHLSRPVRQTAFTGKITTISYNGLSVTSSENGKTKTITKDAAGNVISVSDNGQALSYDYYANNELKSTTYGDHTVSIGIDGWGRKTSLLDPSVSTDAYTYEYNNYGELLEETTPNGTTNYSYSPTGKLESKEIIGDNTNISVEYLYDSKGLIELESGTTNGESHSFAYEYDSLYRLKKKTETTGMPFTLTIVKEFIYDHYSRISEEWTNTSVWSTPTTNLTSSVSVKNHYNTYNGILEHITDKASGATIWKITGANQRMQTISAQLGNGVNIANSYTTLGYISTISHTKTGLTAPLSLSYTFNSQKGTLTNRTNNFYGYTENFTYDNFDRLLSWTTPNGTETNTYEPDGRIKTNTDVGTYSYNTGTRYKKSSIALNTAGKTYYQARQLQEVTYNAFKKPVLITEQGRGSIEFQYGITGVRNKAVEWITDNPNTGANNLFRTKLYSSDGSVEIALRGGASGLGMSTMPLARIITYVGGNAYSAPAMFVTDYQTSTIKSQGYHYLHRDFQGSIMAISNATSVVERRHYDAWGNVSKFTNSSGTTLDNPNLMGGEFFFDRSYTGHEHFFRVGIIHMNGRIYDPVLKGFMSPDNFVQDPQNSQNFNRYAYCMNNPLMYVDPSGEAWGEITLGTAVIVGAVIAAASYTIYALATTWDNFSWGGLLKSTVIGAASGALSFGVGQLASQMFTGICASTSTLTANQVSWIVAAPQAVMHGLSQGWIAGISGGDIGQAFFSAMISSSVSSVTQMGGSSFMGNGDAATLLFGTVSGGLSAELTGGNFWQGAATGLVVSGLNHVAHRVEHKIQERKTILDMLDSMKVNPLDPANISIETLNQMKDGASIVFGEYASVYKDAEFEIALMINNNPKTLGYTSASYFVNSEGKMVGLDHMKKIQIAVRAFGSNYKLAQTVVHELFHYVDNKLGMAMFFYNAYGESKGGYMEYRAYNFTFSIGGFNQINGLINNYKYGSY